MTAYPGIISQQKGKIANMTQKVRSDTRTIPQQIQEAFTERYQIFRIIHFPEVRSVHSFFSLTFRAFLSSHPEISKLIYFHTENILTLSNPL